MEIKGEGLWTKEEGRALRVFKIFMTNFTNITRREALKRVIALSSAMALAEIPAFGATSRGIGTDPNLLKKEIPWPLTLTDLEKQTVSALADIIIPEDENGPAASKVGITNFVDEWVSAPYEYQMNDLDVIRKGLEWLNAEATKRFGKNFAENEAAQHSALLDDIVADGTEARKSGFSFFAKFRALITGGYYSTPEGWKAIGYVGNIPLAEFPGPPPEVLKHLGLA